MPIIKSAKKRVRVAKKASVRNSKTKRGLKAALKLFSRKMDTVSHRAAQSAVDKAVKKGVMHKNKAARAKKQLAARAKASGAKTPVAKKPARVAAKKATARKPTAKRKAA